jgi:hypothetical protein
MNRHALFLAWLLAALAALLGCAQPQASAVVSASQGANAAEQRAERATLSRGFFHRVGGERATVYLLGSVHIGNSDLYPMDPPIERAFEEADTLVLEIDMSERAQLAAQSQMLSVAAYPPGQSLNGELDAKTLALLEQRLRERGLPMTEMARYRPWALAMALVVLELQRAGFAADQGVDLHFAERAQGRRMIGLETAEEQLALFANMTPEQQSKMLRQTLEDLDEAPAQLKQAVLAWKTSDEKLMVSALLAPMQEPEYRDVYEAVFVERNEKMTRAIEELLRGEGTFFVVVGSGHVVGKDGIVARLRTRGHHVEPL